jgi:hypothetical protein
MYLEKTGRTLRILNPPPLKKDAIGYSTAAVTGGLSNPSAV